MLPNSQFPAELVTFTEENRNGKLHFLYSNPHFYFQIVRKRRSSNTFISARVPRDIFSIQTFKKVNPVSTQNHFYNILRLFDILPNFPFTTSETKNNH